MATATVGGGNPFFTTRSEPLAGVTLKLTAKKHCKLVFWGSIATTIPRRCYIDTENQSKTLNLNRNRGVHAWEWPLAIAKRGFKRVRVDPPTVALVTSFWQRYIYDFQLLDRGAQ